jgi:ABC-type transport system substrate-binding protein
LWERIALLVQRDLAQIGVDMSLEAVPIAAFGERLGRADFDTVLLEHVVGNGASRPFSFWHSASKYNAWGFRGPGVDGALADLRQASTDGDYREAFRQYQIRSLEEAPGVFLALAETARAVNQRFEVVAPLGSDILPTIADWRLADGARRGAN